MEILESTSTKNKKNINVFNFFLRYKDTIVRKSLLFFPFKMLKKSFYGSWSKPLVS